MRDPRQSLAETLRHIDSLLVDGRNRHEVIDVPQLSVTSGVPQDVVEMLLTGRQAPAEDITDRIVRRIAHLRETRRRPDGSRHSYDEIASSFGATRASLSNLLSDRRNLRRTAQPPRETRQRPARSGGPLASTQAGVERFFFGEPNGWLSAEPESALNEALQPVLTELRTAAGQHAYHASRALALRTAATLPDDEWELVERFINTLVRQVREERGQGG
ncbi:hypothetical protein ACIHAA_30770 [Streptomyces sp. NPDC052040]|uniref:hypothetical protein n=1 Tax=Streptomyces sp. NPDC052040 TaxID=3365682 RepID=UPI0037D49757